MVTLASDRADRDLEAPDQAETCDGADIADILQSSDDRGMRKLARSPATPADALYYLATVPSSLVRALTAANPATPHQADALLSDDETDEVRASLARKLGRGDRACANAAEVHAALLSKLVGDRATIVRESLARGLAFDIDADTRLLRRLANDSHRTVRDVVLRHAKAFDGRLLVNFIAGGADADTLEMIAARRNLAPEISRLIVDSGLHRPIVALINNHSAELAADCINRLIAAARECRDWRLALANRPGLSTRLLEGLSTHVQTIDPASERASPTPGPRDRDDDGTIAIIEIDSGHADEMKLPTASIEIDNFEPILMRIEQGVADQHAAGRLTGVEIAEAVCLGRDAFIWVALAHLAETDYATVHQIMTSKAPRTISALVWRAGLPAWIAELIQHHTASIATAQVLTPTPDGGYQITDRQMQWLLAPYRIAPMAGLNANDDTLRHLDMAAAG